MIGGPGQKKSFMDLEILDMDYNYQQKTSELVYCPSLQGFKLSDQKVCESKFLNAITTSDNSDKILEILPKINTEF